MQTIVYLIRHSEKINDLKYLENNETLQILNEKRILSIQGEEKAKKLSEIFELQNIDYIVSSNYVRSISTAKYIAEKNKKSINIIENFGERKVGINSLKELPRDYEKRQIEDENYKIGNGESQKEVITRTHKSLDSIINKNRGKRIVIISHATAILFLLKTWCTIDIKKEKSIVIFNKKEVFNSKFNAPEIFKLTFDENNNILNIENIREE